jgi:hypothetical protein
MYDPRVSPPESEILAKPDTRAEVDELEHQALDLLDEQSSPDALSDEVGSAVTVVRGLFLRLAATIGPSLVDAARELAQTEDRGPLEIGMLDEIRLTLTERPQLGLAIDPVRESIGVILGLDRDGAAWTVLLELAEQATAEADGRLHTCSTAITERLAVSGTSRALRVFRSAAVAQAGPSMRARVLAGDHVEHLGLALALVARHEHVPTLVDAFDEARALLEAAAAKRTDEPQIDGPKRKFTRVHVILALIVLGLTLWHYVWR